MPRDDTDASLSCGSLAQCRPLMVNARDVTSDIGSEFELPNT